MGNRNDKLGMNIHINIEDKNAEEKLKLLEAQLTAAGEEAESARSEVRYLEAEIDRLKEVIDNLESATGVDIIKEKLKQFKESAQEAVSEFRAFLQVVKLNDSEGTNDAQFAELFEKIRTGALTANQAILQVKTDMRSLIEENFIRGGGGDAAEIIQSFSAALNHLGETCSTILSKLQDLSTNGIPATGTAATSGAGNIAAALEEIRSAAGAMAGDVPNAYEQMTHLFEAVTAYATVDAEKLYHVAEAFRGIASIGTGQYGKQSVDNIVSLIKQLNAFSGGDGINLRFHTQGLNDLKVSRSALSNVATYLPQIASVNVDQLEGISKIDWSNFANLKVDKASLEAIAQMAQALSSAGGATGQAEKQKSDFADAKSSLQEYYRLLMEVEKKRSRTTSISGSKDYGFSADEGSAYEELVKQLNAAKNAADRYREGQDGVNLSEEEHTKLLAIRAEYEANYARELPIIEERGKAAYANLADKVNTYVEQHRYAASRSAEATQALDELQRMANKGDWRGFDELKKKLAEVQNLINRNSLSTETWFQKMKKTFGTRARSLLAGLTIGKITQSIRDVYKYVLEIDTAMTNLKIVTKENDSALQRYAETAKKAAVSIGASVSDIIKSTTTYARLGFSLNEAGKLGELTTAYSKVGDVSVDDATKNITGIVKAYQVSGDALEGVIDKLIYVGRRFAISSAEIGEGMNNAASSLSATGNTLNQAMGILTAANTTVQNISRASTATRTIAARLSASKQELEELGETVEADTVFKLSNAFKAYGIEIQYGNGQLKSTYEILNTIASKWEELDDAQRSAIAGLAAGTRQQDVFYSIIQNWSDAKRVVSEVGSSFGELAKATEERLDSIQGKIDQVKAKFESFSQTVLSSDWVKTVADAIGGTLSVLNSVLSLGDGLIAKIGLISVLLAVFTKAWIGLKAVFLSAKASMVELIALQKALAGAQATTITTTKLLAAATLKYTSTGLLGIITVIPRAIIALGLWIKSHIAAKLATDAGTVSAITFKGALDALNVNPVMLAITALVAACVGAFAAIKKFSKAQYEAAQKAKEETQSLRDKANALKEEITLVDELAERYKELSSSGEIDADKRKEIRDIQKQINRLTGAQVKDFDLVNGKLDEQIAKFNQIRAIKAKEAANTAANALFASEYAASIASEGRSLAGGYTYNKLDGSDIQGIRLLNSVVSEVTGGKITGMADEYGGTAIYFKGLNGAKEYVDAIEKALDALETASDYDYVHGEVYQALAGLLPKYKEYLDAIDSTKDEFISQTVEMFGYQNNLTVQTIDDYNRLRNELIRLTEQDAKVTTAMKSGLVVQQDINDAVDDFLSANYPDFYNARIRDANGISVALKTVSDILDEIQPGFDGLTDIMKELSHEGYLTADMISKLAKLEEEGALGGLELKKILLEETDGYKLAEDALDQYVKSIILANSVEYDFMTSTDQMNAEANLENLRRVLLTLVRTEDDATDSIKAQKESLKDQLDAYKKLVDLRKKLLKQYEDELNYKKGLEEREKKVAQLQSRLAVSQLDTSAAGRAKSREIANDLQEANEDLDDFTLEHAIEVVTNNLDEQYEEYESYINEKINELEHSVEETEKTNVSGIESWLKTIETILEEIRDKKVAGTNDDDSEGNGDEKEKKEWRANTSLTKGSDYSVSGLSTVSMGKDDISVTIDGKKYNTKISTKKVSLPSLDSMYGGEIPDEGTIAVLGDKAYIVKKGSWRQLVEEDSSKIVSAYLAKLNSKNTNNEYHSGGVVGNTPGLKTTEMFAKLLKGEFVATPQMMKRFMTSTLPELARSGASGGSNEFNAPLISIQCDNVTQESLPGLKEIVEDAVKQIKKQLDDGLGRAGFHKTVKQIV